MAISLKGHIVIVDEAHNIEGICRDVGGAEFREDHLGEAIEDCTLVFNQTFPKNFSYETIQKYLTSFVDLMLDQVLKKISVSLIVMHSNCLTLKIWTKNSSQFIFAELQL